MTLQNTQKAFNDAFEAEIESQEFMIDEAEWNAVIKALKAGHNSFAKQIEKDILELIDELPIILMGDPTEQLLDKSEFLTKLKEYCSNITQ